MWRIIYEGVIFISVLKNKRGESKVQFLETAREIHVFTIKQAVKFPNKYKYCIANDMVKTAFDAHMAVKEANSINPKTKSHARMREERFMIAYAKYQSLVSCVFVAEEFVDFSNTAITEWMTLINNELELLKRIITSDRERYKGLSD